MDAEAQIAEMRDELEKVKRENFKLRDKNRRAELAVEHGPEVVQLIPPELPLEQWQEHVARIMAAKGATPAAEAEPAPPAPDPEREAAEAVMAALVNTGSGQPLQADITAEEIDAARKAGDLARATELAQRKYGQGG